jgi:hypothetical protein
MDEVFDRSLRRNAFPSGDIAIMRAAYLTAAASLNLNDNAERRRIAKIVQKIARLERLPAAPVLARIAADWYVSELAND